ncbi:hypothetical protein HYC85_009613 [Camellia sinensis]|uniref:4-coumarate--CoA ligase n=1 Tax=Camellia sinensis TaxID=4442 RepID=A0A7J7HG59_CAMSI|nr:hypothetical protein HYC85_009613 [Camellia sinensis]
MAVYTVKVEESKPGSDEKASAGAVYRSIYAKNGLTELPAGMHSPWDFFSDSVRGTQKTQCWDAAKSGVPMYGSHMTRPMMLPFESAPPSAAAISILVTGVAYMDRIAQNGSSQCSFGEISSMQKKETEDLGIACFSWKEFTLLGSLDHELPSKQRTDICTIMYTSGTTAEPKGVILTNGAIMAEVLSTDQLLLETDKVDIRYLIEDIVELKPTIFCGVPRVFDRIYTEKGIQQDKAAPLLDRLVFDKIKQGFGGRVRIMLSGAAPLPSHVEEFLRVTCCCVLSQGYGLTESCGGCLTSVANVFSMMGTVGVPMTTIEARLESVPELGYNALATVPRGEICLRGKTLFSGYHKRQDLIEDVLVDGWFHTGDIGEWQPNGAMKIIDRKKNIFKLSQGEYIAVENIENTYSRCPLVTSIWVYGNSFESFLVAVVVPDRKMLEEWVANNNESGDFKLLCENLKARKYILDELNSTGQKHKLRGFEVLKAVHLEPNPFDIDRDLITPTFKLKRPQLLKYYKDCIDQLYYEAKGKKQ